MDGVAYIPGFHRTLKVGVCPPRYVSESQNFWSYLALT
jgi:hypothetical protein